MNHKFLKSGLLSLLALGCIFTAKAEFADFTIDLTQNPVAELPAGVTQISYPQNGVSFNGSQHGWCWYAVQFDVDGPVDITLGGCQYINAGYEAYLEADGERIADIATKTAACWDADKVNNVGKYTYAGGAATLKLYCGQYCPFVKVKTVNLDPDPETPTVTEKPELTQVWDFGAQMFGGVQNMLSVAEINSWYPADAQPGTGTQIGDIKEANDSVNFYFEYNGKANGRIRSTNENLIRYDDKSLKSPDGGTVYTGYLYSNTSSTADVYVRQSFKKNDKVTYVLGSNGNPAEYHFVNEEIGYDKVYKFTETGKATEAVFYVPEDGDYKLYCIDEKLVLARITRVPATYVAVSGAIDAPADIPAGYRVVFNNVETGAVQEAKVIDGKYATVLAKGYHYNVKLSQVNGFSITTSMPILIDDTKTDCNIAVEAIPQVTVTGTITGLPEVAKAQFVFETPAGKVYAPEMTVNADGTYSLTLEKDVTYNFSVEGVNDFMLADYTISASADETGRDIAFSLKPTYEVTIVPTGATAEELADAVFIYNNENEEGYTYTFTGVKAQLRSGVYSVVGTNLGKFGQMLTPNLKVDGEARNFNVDFESGFTAWNFADASFAQGGYTNAAAEYNYRGLEFKGGQINKIYLLINKDAVVKVPVTGPCKVQVSSCYEAHFGVAEGEEKVETLRDAKSGSTSQIDVDEYAYAGEAGFVTIQGLGTTYITAIKVIYPAMPYVATITVGADKQYTTILDALEAIRNMNRDAETERVTVMIDPGTYEEMPTIDVKNITFRNAAATPSIAMKNAGVDIDESAVRITGYYGHGYNYYSMDDEYAWSARKLEVNKVNGSASIKNGGGAPARMWNATTLVTAPGFEAYDIIFENSFNQYISAKEAQDVVIDNGAGKGPRPTTVGSTEVQKKKYIERASAISFTASADRAYLKNCRFVGHQDVVYGAIGARVAVDGGILQGGTDYIFGGMTLVAYKAEIAINVESDKNDVAYITASQNDATTSRGYLFANCRVRSVEPKVEMACESYAKPALWGRPWAGNGETVFIGTYIDATKAEGYSGSMIAPEGWNNGLVSSGAKYSVEYATFEEAGVDNSAKRVSWSSVLTEAKVSDGTEITLFNWTKGSDDWNPFQDAAIDVTTNPYTGIEAVNVQSVMGTKKVVVNNQVVILSNGKRFNLQGIEM